MSTTLSVKKRPHILRQFSRSVPGMLGLGLILIVAVLSLGAPLFTAYDPLRMDTTSMLEPPSAGHPLGTDDFGRDVYTRVLYGGRVSLLVAVLVSSITACTGSFFGVVSGFYRRVDGPVMRVMDIVMAFPTILLALGIVAIMGPQLVNIIIALVVPYTPRTARIVRSVVLHIKEEDFVTAARSVGATDGRIMLRHILPNSMAPLLVQQTFQLALAILAEAALTFLGVGVPPEVPTLGGIISEGRALLRTAPWLSLYPGIAIMALVLGFNLMGDGLRDVLDPRLRQ